MNMPSEAESDIVSPNPNKPKSIPFKTITMADISKATGVSQGAISSLLNAREYGIRVSENTKDKIFAAVRELGYVPNDLRAFVRAYPAKGDTCLLIPQKLQAGLTSSFCSRVANAVLANTSDEKGGLSIAYYDETGIYDSADKMLPLPVKNATASKFLYLGAPNTSLNKWIKYPTIALGNEVPNMASVVPNYADAVKMALSHLAEHGHRNIAILGGPFGSPELRFQELNQAIGAESAHLGLQIESQNIFQCDLSFQAGMQAMQSLLTRTDRPTAVFAFSETVASGLIAQAIASQIAIPSQLSVISLTHHQETPNALLPMTSVALSIDEMVTLALQEAGRQHREGLLSNGSKRIPLAPILCKRESVAKFG
jgi:LacI family transcriptional regulator